MHPKVREWFNIHGRNLAELKIRGGSELLKPLQARVESKLTTDEQAGFLVLTGQLDALMWIFSPEDPDEALVFLGEISTLLEQYENEAILIEDSGIINIPRGEA